MSIDLTQVILAVIALLGTVLTTFIIPLLKAKLDIERSNLSESQANMLRLAITTAVTAAEQLYNSNEGQQKKAYVLNYLKMQGYEVDGAAIDAQIEAIVKEVHEEFKK